jgi:hypothetical protein
MYSCILEYISFWIVHTYQRERNTTLVLSGSCIFNIFPDMVMISWFVAIFRNVILHVSSLYSTKWDTDTLDADTY